MIPTSQEARHATKQSECDPPQPAQPPTVNFGEIVALLHRFEEILCAIHNLQLEQLSVLRRINSSLP